MMQFPVADLSVADLCDAGAEEVAVCDIQFRSFGGQARFHGRCATLLVREDHRPVAAALGEPGNGRVLIVDGGGSLKAALLGDRLAALALENGWAGLVLNGAVRDLEALAALRLGVMAIGSCPRRGAGGGEGRRGAPVQFGGVTFCEHDWAYADADGVILARRPLHLA
jgi:regulator of ribonuclease activity A